MPFQRTLVACYAAAACALTLAGCGNKSVLVLPPKPDTSANKASAAKSPADHNSVPSANRQ